MSRLEWLGTGIWMRGDREITGRQPWRCRFTWIDVVEVDLRGMEVTRRRTRVLERTEWASVERNFVLEALNWGAIVRPKPGRRCENNTKLEVRESEGKFGDWLRIGIVGTEQHTIWLRDWDFQCDIDQDLNLLGCYMNFRHMDKRLNLCELSLEVFVAVVMKQNISKQLAL
jgi:hypothetical protein